MARSNSAKAPTICIIIRPAGLVVSIATGQATKSHLCLGQPLHDRQHIPERPRQEIECPDNEHVAFAKLIKESMQLRPVPASTRCFLAVDTFAPCRL
jgi:hypothetical protein